MSWLVDKQAEFSQMVASLLIYADSMGYKITLGSACPNDRTGHMDGSLHYERLAIDLNAFKKGKYLRHTADYRELGMYWERLGGAWGGRFGDGNHFSLPYDGRK